MSLKRKNGSRLKKVKMDISLRPAREHKDGDDLREILRVDYNEIRLLFSSLSFSDLCSSEV